MPGLLLIGNPEFATKRWAWELNPLDAPDRRGVVDGLGVLVRDDGRRAADWDEMRGRGIRLGIVNGVALLATVVVLLQRPDRRDQELVHRRV